MSITNSYGAYKMIKVIFSILTLAVIFQSPAHAVSEKYRQRLEHSGCSQQTELLGCDFNKTKIQNARSGYGKNDGGQAITTVRFSAFAGNYAANRKNGEKTAEIHIEQQSVYVNGKEIKDVNHLGDILTFQQGYVTYTLSVKQSAKNIWTDSNTKNSGTIVKE